MSYCVPWVAHGAGISAGCYALGMLAVRFRVGEWRPRSGMDESRVHPRCESRTAVGCELSTTYEQHA